MATKYRHDFYVGEGVHWRTGVDIRAGTITRIGGSYIYVVEDCARLLNGPDSGEPDALHSSAGGFCAHVSGTQRYAFGRDTSPDACELRFTPRGARAVHQLVGAGGKGSLRHWGILRHGRTKHYDYNY